MYFTADYMTLMQMLSKSVFISSASCAVYLIYTEMFFQYSLRLYKSGQLARLNPIKYTRSFAPTFLSMFAITFPTSFFYLNFVKASPVQWTYSFNIASATVLTTIFLLISDTFFFHIHYALHKNKRLFALVHANHHTQKNVTAWSTGVAEFSENLILIAPIWVMYTYFTIFVRGELNIWDYFIPFITSSYIFVRKFVLSVVNYPPRSADDLLESFHRRILLYPFPTQSATLDLFAQTINCRFHSLFCSF
ncbi:hypothetical protein BKA69DRAFT_942254 [Paraphysoderma sedebokerense]|nr:hypothetical protein BKA69DRAFT_942254 [Paraphysoderma sedebokerense]